MEDQSASFKAALELAGQGYYVIPVCVPTKNPEKPCSCGRPYATGKHANKPCTAPGKHPCWSKEFPLKGFSDATTDPDLIRQWWGHEPGAFPAANIGINLDKSC